MTSNLSVLLKKYSVPVLFMIAGLSIFIIGVMDKQSALFMISSIMMFIAGGLSVLFSSGKTNVKLLYAFGGLAGVAAIYTLAASWIAVDDYVKHQETYEQTKTTARQNLEDIRFIQKEYKKRNGTYLATWVELVDFVQSGKINRIVSEGTVPSRKINEDERDYLYGDNRPIDNNMTEEEAYRLSLWKEGPLYADFTGFKRDTVPVSILKAKFQTKSYRENRERLNLGEFCADSLPYIPLTHGKEMWTMETRDSVLVGDMKVPAIKVSGILPIAEYKGKTANEEMFFGTLTSGDLTGSWEAE